MDVLTPIKHCATITFDQKSGMILGLLVWLAAVKPGHDRSVERLISSRVEEIHKTSREPNGRTREEGSDGRGNPRRGFPNELWRGVPLLALELVSRGDMA